MCTRKYAYSSSRFAGVQFVGMPKGKEPEVGKERDIKVLATQDINLDASN